MSTRNRIVIDLNQPPQPRVKAKRARSRQSHGAGRVLAIIGIIIVVVLLGTAAGVYFWWQHYKAQPAYMLALLVDAAQRDDNQEIERMHLQEEPPRPSRYVDVSPLIDAVVLCCMAKSPDARYPSVRAFLAALEAAVGA